MKVTDTFQICPYTGLRSFTEEESLYFKGRDEQVDQVTTQLEERKFLMLTGASGEGKSSLIYAGLIPNARAGFFRARYANWTVVDFRPERSPVKSMARALADKFSISAATIETEMSRGFSSLVDLYVSSDFYVNENDEAWKQLSEDERKLRTRHASNLLILVDQFEELFTNPENYFNENPSQDSQVVVNLILETSKIALEQNLPIYIVCTMRSDYIGQCSSFRGLPEYIGYSQFFVPRLKRKELKQVIEEPALLSGNKITNRLTERLVYDVAEGVDQLPILQHALSQIWLMANRGTEEMDLIHYAMVGGMPSSELPDEDKVPFDSWYKSLPEYQQKFHQETGLNKVIENHASRLYESALENYNNENSDRSITIRDAKNIIALTFSCLTKIDNSRAVRNRMTLREITAIINRPTLTDEVVGKVLNIFREEGNSFIRPFKTEDKSSHILSSDTVLDITHESLIRNWGMLHKWASQEFEYYSTFLDLKKQLDRWKEHNKSTGYLLPIGPLSYFENWYAKCNPNTAWINRYIEKHDDGSTNWKISETLLQDIGEFLKKSARHVLITRAFLKYGAQKIAIVSSIFILLVLCGFYWYDAQSKKNENVLKRVQAEAQPLLMSPEVSNVDKAAYLLTNERLTSGSLIPYIETIGDLKERIRLSVDTYQELMLIDKKFTGQLKLELIKAIRRDLRSASVKNDNEFRLAQINKFIIVLAYDNYYNAAADLEAILRDEASALDELVLSFYKNKQLYKVSVSINLNQAVQHWLTFGTVTKERVVTLLSLISPRSNPEAKSTFDVFYPKGSYEANGIRPQDFNGGYHTIASIYAATGDVAGVIWCFEQIRAQQDYFSDKLFNNYLNVIGYFYQYGYRSSVPLVVNWIHTNYPTNTNDVIYRDLVVRSGYLSTKFRVNFQIKFQQLENGNFYLNLCLGSRDQFMAIQEDYEKSLEAIKDPSERNFLLAIHFKRRALFEHKYHFDRGLSISEDYLDGLFDKAWSNFLLIRQTDLNKKITISYPFFAQVTSKDFTWRELFVYPDYLGGWLSGIYHSDLFFTYLKKKGLLSRAYQTPEELNQIHFWVANVFERLIFAGAQTMIHDYPVADATLVRALEFVQQHSAGNGFDGNLFVLILANRAFERGDSTAGLDYYSRFKQSDFTRSMNRYEIWNKNFFANQVKELAMNLARIGRPKQAVQLVEKFETNTTKISQYAYIAKEIYNNNYDPATFIFLDSAMSKLKTEPAIVAFFREYRNRLTYLLSKIGGEKMIALGNALVRNAPEGRKFLSIRGMAIGNAERGDYYSAYTSIPNTLTEEQDLIVRTEIVLQAAKDQESKINSAGWKAMDDLYAWDDYMLPFGFL